ncbi:MAG: alpha/beta hydrolase [Pseudomonadales bacterium]|nr:alpha/beta hydrolase [Pseudomonadales bacterium]
MIRKILKLLGIVLAVLVLGVAATYVISRNSLLDQLESTGRIAQTAAGPVQYSLSGNAGPVILFVHGTPGGFDHTPFFTIAGLEGFRLLTLSRPGYLGTPLEVGRAPEEQARAYAALLDELGIDEVIVWGVSGGGPSAIAFAALYPQRTQAFVGLEILSQPYSEPLDIPTVMKSDFLSWLGISLVTRFGDGKAALGMLPHDEAENIIGSSSGLERVQTWLWSIWPVSQRLAGWRNDSEHFMTMSLPAGQITAPALILNGTADEAVDYESAKELSELIPGARLYTVEGGNHAMLLSRKDELNEVITTFLVDAL